MNVTGPSHPAEPLQPAVGAEETTAAPRTDGTVVVAFVCAVLSWMVLPFVLAIVALALVRGASPAGGLATATRWVAWLNLLVVAMGVAFVASFIVAIWIGR